MKPIIILPPDTVSDPDIQLLRDNDLCVVVAKEPGAVKFLDPLPVASSRDQIENAAIQLSRRLLRGDILANYRGELCSLFARILVEGTPLQPGPTQAENEKDNYDVARIDEVRRLAREDAKAERAAKKAKGK